MKGSLLLAKMSSQEHPLVAIEPTEPETKAHKYAMMALDGFLAAIVVILIAYVVYLEFDMWALIFALSLTIVGFVAYRKRLHEFTKDETLYWTMLAALGLFMTSFSTTADLTSTHLVLSTTFIVALMSLWTNNAFFVLMTAFLMAYIAFRLLIAHLPPL